MLGGVEEDVAVDEGNACLTNPDEAVQFVNSTRCDALAAAIGTSHGAYKFKGQQSLHFDVIEAIQKRIPGTPSLMHGQFERAEGGGDANQRSGGRLDSQRARRCRRRVLTRGEARVTKVKHRHRRPLGLDACPSGIFPGQATGVRISPSGKIFMDVTQNSSRTKTRSSARRGSSPQFVSSLAK